MTTKAGQGAREGGRLLSRTELAEALDVSAQAIDHWRRRGCPVESRGRGGRRIYNLARVVEWRLERATVDARRSDEEIDLDRLRRRRALAETERAELELERARNEVVPLDLTIAMYSDMVRNMKAKLLAFPGRDAARLARLQTAPKCKKLLREGVRETLLELAKPDTASDRILDEIAAPRKKKAPLRQRVLYRGAG